MMKKRGREVTLRGYVVDEKKRIISQPAPPDRLLSLEDKIRRALDELKEGEIMTPNTINYDELVKSITSVYKIMGLIAIKTKYGNFVLLKSSPEKIIDREPSMINFPFDGRKIIIKRGGTKFYICGIKGKQDCSVKVSAEFDLPDLSEFLIEE